MKEVIIYGTAVCPYCEKARALLNQLQIPFKEVDVSKDLAYKNELKKKFNWPTIPMITIGDNFVGGFDDLNRLHEKGELITKL